MNRLRTAFVVALAVATVLSTMAAFPLTNVVTGNDAGWFTMQNIDDYADDLDERAEANGGEVVVLTGHPSYVMGTENASLLFDMPRNHYYASTFNDTDVGDEFYSRLTRALETGQADIAITGPMTETIFQQNRTAARVFEENYCEVADPEAQRLYQRTHATLYRYQPNECPADRRPETDG